MWKDLELKHLFYKSKLMWILFLNKESNTNLTLYISPYLRESGPIKFTSDRPGELKEQFKEFIRFIHFLRQLKKLNINGISELIPDEFSITLKHFSGKFPVEYIQKRKQTHKRKLAKKSRKSWKSRK